MQADPLGAALAYWHKELKKPRYIYKKDSMSGSYLGPSYGVKIIEKELNNLKFIFKKFKYDDLIKEIAKQLSDQKIIGWFQGRMEFGPRALGSRSILADPRSDEMQKILNLKIKFRESFRPFAPSILNDDVFDWFNINCDSPYMLLVSKIKDLYESR